MTKLLPCPFCGSDDIDAAFWRSDNDRCGPGCMACGSTAETSEKWNLRENEALRIALKDIFAGSTDPIVSRIAARALAGLTSTVSAALRGTET